RRKVAFDWFAGARPGGEARIRLASARATNRERPRRLRSGRSPAFAVSTGVRTLQLGDVDLLHAQERVRDPVGLLGRAPCHKLTELHQNHLPGETESVF